MAKPTPLRVDDALDELVNQFADPLSFLRELVQNALDAGSSEVEVRVDFEGEGEQGVAVVRVDDWGDGMTREIIEKRLTRLFSSAKDGDMTKIGKFGIGFVSVFAIEPDAVCVDTSREGEAWRVLFDKERRFKLLRLEAPVDGTKIRILKSMARADFDDFVGRVGRVLRYWCRHTRGEITFNGRRVNEALDLPDPCRVAVDDGFSQVVVGHPHNGRSFYGFYNTGLTLIEGGAQYYEGLAFKASSPHLEHTLTRDSIIKDAGYHRVLEAVDDAVHGPLCERAFAMLERAVRRGRTGEALEYLYRAAWWHWKDTQDKPRSVMERAVFVTPGGKELSVRAMLGEHRHSTVVTTPVHGPLSHALEVQGYTVVLGNAQGAFRGLLAALTGTESALTPAADAFCHAAQVDPEAVPPGWAALSRAVAALVEGFGGKLSHVALGRFAYPGSSIANEVAITQAKFGEVTPLREAAVLGRGLFGSRRVLVVSADHNATRPLLALAQREPHFAAYLLVKLFFLGQGLSAETDGTLARLTMEHRWQASRT